MSKKKPEPKKVNTTTESVVMRHARIELPDSDYRRLKRAAERVRISVAAYIRLAVMQQIAEDDRRFGDKA
jgi:hypothetical protein